jgi:ketopantoate reductase
MDLLFEESYRVLSKKYEIKPKKEFKELFYQVISPMKHYSSTYQDAMMKKPSEAKYLNGLIVDLGKEFGIPTLENHKLMAEFKKRYPKSA